MHFRQRIWPDARLVGHALAASVLNVALLFAFFDGLAFPITAGLLFVLVGLCGAIRTVAAANQTVPVWTPRASALSAAAGATVYEPVPAEPADSSRRPSEGSVE